MEDNSQNPTNEAVRRAGKARVNQADRSRIEWQAIKLDNLLPEEHQARVVWAWVEGMALKGMYDRIKVVEGGPGRSATDPRILMGLWLYATLEGVGSARELERLCKEHLAYRWMCGGVGMNYHTLADFRVQPVEDLDQLLIEGVAALRSEGLVTLKRVVQDGKKVRASAGSSSFHRKDKLAQHLEEARQQVEALRQELEADPGAADKRKTAAREQAAKQRQARIEKAQQQLEAMQAQAKKSGRDKVDARNPKKQERRASSTDPEARKMKMADGGFRPAYNVQFCTDSGSNLILGLDVSQQGNDSGLASPMMIQLKAGYQIVPEELLADTSYGSKAEICTLTAQGVTPYISIALKGGISREAVYLPRKRDPKAVAAWRIRMGSEAGQAIAKQRGQVAELVHAVLDQKHLDRMVVRGKQKVRAVMLWFALVHNFIRTRLLRQRQAQAQLV